MNTKLRYNSGNISSCQLEVIYILSLIDDTPRKGWRSCLICFRKKKPKTRICGCTKITNQNFVSVFVDVIFFPFGSEQ